MKVTHPRFPEIARNVDDPSQWIKAGWRAEVAPKPKPVPRPPKRARHRNRK